MEHRVVLTNEEAFELSNELTFLSSGYVKDEYNGKTRIRIDEINERKEKEYKTPVSGIVHRFSSSCKLGDLEGVWFEFKWTDKTSRFEIEFEGEVPDAFKGRSNIKGWQILE